MPESIFSCFHQFLTLLHPNQFSHLMPDWIFLRLTFLGRIEMQCKHCINPVYIKPLNRNKILGQLFGIFVLFFWFNKWKDVICGFSFIHLLLINHFSNLNWEKWNGTCSDFLSYLYVSSFVTKDGTKFWQKLFKVSFLISVLCILKQYECFSILSVRNMRNNSVWE